MSTAEPTSSPLPTKGHAHGSCDCGHDHHSHRRATPGDGSSSDSLWAALAPALACALCPACLTTYAKVFATVGVGAALTAGQHLAVLLVAVAISLGISGYRTWRSGRAWPLVVALAGCGLLVLGHLWREGLEWAGMATLLVGGVGEQQLARHNARKATHAHAHAELEDMAEASTLSAAWDQVAGGYDAYFVPRFAPWVRDACEGLRPPLPGGAIAVPCCGTGPELALLAEQHPGRPLLGVDLSAGMLRLASERTRHLPAVTTRVGDAAATEGWPACAGVVSVFGLQQMPEPAAALRRWTEALVPGGLLSVVYWPRIVEEDGPFAWFRGAVTRRLPAPDGSWEEALTDALRQGGAQLLSDEMRHHEMRHEDASAFLDAILSSGPGRALATTQGETWIDKLRSDFLAAAPAGPLAHRPRARHLLACRPG